MDPQVEAWLALAEDAKTHITSAIREFKLLSANYEGIRNIGYKDDEKEQIDIAYAEVYQLHSTLCKLQAGGKRKPRKTRKQRNH
jgi:cystathionine beta-lyase family protein involved in aluminum resistance